MSCPYCPVIENKKQKKCRDEKIKKWLVYLLNEIPNGWLEI